MLIAVIGPTWFGVGQDGVPRINAPRDFVRVEIESALALNIPILPVLTGSTPMPSPDDLPEVLRPLAYLNALQVRAGRVFHQDVDAVVRAVVHITSPGHVTAMAEPGTQSTTALGLREVVLPAGTFLMGSPEADRHASEDEKPQARVRIAQPFLMGVTPVTQAEFEKVLAYNPSKFVGDCKRPVDTVSLADAADFCNALSQLEGLLPYYEIRGQAVEVAGGPSYRLPSESEWEYACRAGSTTKWSFGDQELDAPEYAWFSANAEDTTHPSGAKLPNPWGLHDMHGNVWELCWGELQEGGGPPGRAPSSIAPPSECILRGGCFVDPAWGIRSAYRSSIRVAVRSSRTGFRVARSIHY